MLRTHIAFDAALVAVSERYSILDPDIDAESHGKAVTATLKAYIDGAQRVNNVKDIRFAVHASFPGAKGADFSSLKAIIGTVQLITDVIESSTDEAAARSAEIAAARIRVTSFLDGREQLRQQLEMEFESDLVHSACTDESHHLLASDLRTLLAAAIDGRPRP